MARNTLIPYLACFAALFLLFGGACKKSPQQESPVHSVYDSELQDELPPAELEEERKTASGSKAASLEKFSFTWTGSEEMPDVLIIVDDFGNSGALLDDFAQLPQEVVFAVLPDLSHTRASGEIASQSGHEVLIHLPMQAVSKSNPGARYIKTTSTSEEIAALIADFRAQLPMAAGANNHMGSAVTANQTAMTAVLNELSSNKLVFVDSATSAQSVAPALARSLGLPALKRDIFLDVPDSSDATLADKIESLGRFKGRRQPIVIITHCHSQAKLEALQKFIAQIQAMGLRLTTLAGARGLAV